MGVGHLYAGILKQHHYDRKGGISECEGTELRMLKVEEGIFEHGSGPKHERARYQKAVGRSRSYLMRTEELINDYKTKHLPTSMPRWTWRTVSNIMCSMISFSGINVVAMHALRMRSVKTWFMSRGTANVSQQSVSGIQRREELKLIIVEKEKNQKQTQRKIKKPANVKQKVNK